MLAKLLWVIMSLACVLGLFWRLPQLQSLQESNSRSLRENGNATESNIHSSCRSNVKDAHEMELACELLDKKQCEAIPYSFCRWEELGEGRLHFSVEDKTCEPASERIPNEACAHLDAEQCSRFESVGICKFVGHLLLLPHTSNEHILLEEAGFAGNVCFLLIIVILLFCQVGCCVIIVRNDCASPWWRGDGSIQYTLLTTKEFDEFLQQADESGIRRVLQREARLMMLLPLLPAAATPWTTCESGTPNLVYALYIPFLLRAKMIEFRIIGAIAQGTQKIVAYILLVVSIVDHYDWFSDGAFPSNAYACDDSMTSRFAESFVESSVPWLATTVIKVRFWGLALLLFGAAGLAQQASTFSDSESKASMALAADVAGMAGVSYIFDDDFGPTSAKYAATVLTFTKVLVENDLQTWLQSSGFAMSFDQMSDSARIKILLCMGFGLASASLKSLQGLISSVKLCLAGGPGPGIGLFTFTINSISLCVVAWVVAKIYYAYECPSHIWNLTSGCVNGAFPIT